MKRTLIRYLLLTVSLAFIALAILFYTIFIGKGIRVIGDKTTLFLTDDMSFEQVLDTLDHKFDIRNNKILLWVAKNKNYSNHIRPGRYVFENDMSYNRLINYLRSGSQIPVNVTFNNIRTIYDLAAKVGGQIEADSSAIAGFLADPSNYEQDGFTRDNIIAVFIPNTYQLYWNTSPYGFYTRMLREYNRFWEGDRQKRVDSLGLTRIEVSILASIIDDEVVKQEEKPRIAGVYLNRLRRGIPLQACPTIKFALNDFTITRILNKYLEVESPFNTYKYKGFPPGPIGCATIDGIDAVLHAEKHDYLFFAAKSDFSGYHNFSRTLAEHNRYAAEYQRELDRRKIFR